MLQSSDEARRGAVLRVADHLEANAAAIHEANRDDLAKETDPILLGRLALGPAKLAAALDGMRQVASLPDPLGETVRSTILDDGLHLWQVTCPIGVVACIFESRPDVCLQIPALTLRSGNAALLKGGKEAAHTNRVLIDLIREALGDSSLPADAVQGVETREDVQTLLGFDDLIDLIVPRGSNALVRSIQANTHIPVMGHAAGICHIYVDEDADLAMATRVILDAKTDYPSACNAVETVLVHKAHEAWLPTLTEALGKAGVTIHDKDPDFDREYGDLQLNLASVDSLDAALHHIQTHGSKHTDCIITQSDEAKQRFVAGVDAAGVYVNASTRFADGYRYGLGAEVGISTGKLHARGPVGLEGLVTTRWILEGHGDTVSARSKAFLHEPGAPFVGWP